MNCNKYQQLSLPERYEMIGKIVHLLQNDDNTFEEVEWLIRMGDVSGKLDNIVILPEEIKTPSYEEIDI